MFPASDQLPELLNRHRGAPRWWLAFSGGLDSTVLLHYLWELAQQHPLPPLQAIHINHQLHPAAAQWAEHCAAQCQRLAIPFAVHKVTIDPAAGGLEQAARLQRYRVFAEQMQAADCLLLGHHQNDQLETLLLRLTRGAGVVGLAGMPQSRALGRGTLLRPLLQLSREQLLAYARQRQLSWLEDPSNADTSLDRNLLRNKVLPPLLQRWPKAPQAAARAADHLAENKMLLAELAAADLDAQPEQLPPLLPLQRWRELSSLRQTNVLRHWLRQHGGQWPTQTQLQHVLSQVIAAAPDAQPQLQLGAWQIRRFRDHLYCLAPLPALDTQWQSSWSAQTEITLPGAGSLQPLANSPVGIAGLDRAVVRFGRAGLRCKPQGRPHSASLKQLLHEHGVPPWLRDRVPLLFVDEQLAAVADLWVCEGHAAQPGTGVRWLPPGG